MPQLPSNTSDESESETSGNDTSSGKSPLLTAHRISVTSDMDDVSLDGGKCTHGVGVVPWVVCMLEC